MNKILYTFLFTAVTFAASAQVTVDRSKQPKAGPAPVIEFKNPEIFTLPNGMTILVVENHKLPRVSATLNIDMGPVKEGEKSGIMQLMGQMMGEGTKSMPKAKFDESIDLLGADVNLNSTGGYTGALTRYFSQAFMLMADALKNPAFPQESFEKLQKQTITGLKSGEKSASTISGRVVNALGYGKHTAMGEFVTEESVKALTLNDVKQAYKDHITPSRSYLTFIGDITPGKAKELATNAFGSWTGKKLPVPEFANVDNVPATEIDFIDVPTAVQGELSVTNLINNPMSGKDYHALLIANQILGGGAEAKLFMNLREKHGFTYGSYANTGNGRFQAMFKTSAQVRSEKADSAVVEMLSEIDNMRNGKITEEELASAKAKYNGSFALKMEDPANTATYASNILINGLEKDFYRTFLQKINALTIADVQRVAKKYYTRDNARIVIVGNGAKILPNLSRLGFPIKLYDKYAEPIANKPKETAVGESDKNSEAVTAFSIINDYLKAIGGKDEAKKLVSQKANISLSVQGITLEGTQIKMAPNKEHTILKMGGNVAMEKVFDGAKGHQSQMGKSAEMDTAEVKEAMDEKGIIPQVYYITNDYKTSYLGVEKVNDQNAYKIKITKPSGKVSTEYYSTKTALLIREESTETAGGEETAVIVDYSDYQKVGTLLFPLTITQSAGGQDLVFKFSDVKINEGVTDADFK
ncbi:MAG: insulinase family protein [Ferruginibacter sp.]